MFLWGVYAVGDEENGVGDCIGNDMLIFCISAVNKMSHLLSANTFLGDFHQSLPINWEVAYSGPRHVGDGSLSWQVSRLKGRASSVEFLGRGMVGMRILVLKLVTKLQPRSMVEMVCLNR